jgi:serine protease AprX
MTLQLLPEGIRASRGRPLPALLAGILALALLLPAVQAGQLAGALISVIVREAPGAGTLPEQLVESSGGTVTRALPIIDGFAAELPRSAIPRIASDPAVLSITPNAPVQMQSDGYAAGSDLGSMHSTARLIGANHFWAAGFTGSGVDVAIIDSGVSPVLGLNGAGKVIRGPDLSFESQAPNLRFLDTFGHGTFMAGLIAGHEPGAQVNLCLVYT